MFKSGQPSPLSEDDEDELPLEIEVDPDLPFRRLACAVLTCALMDLKKRDEYHQSTARDFVFSTCEAVRTHRHILVQTARWIRIGFQRAWRDSLTDQCRGYLASEEPRTV